MITFINTKVEEHPLKIHNTTDQEKNILLVLGTSSPHSQCCCNREVAKILLGLVGPYGRQGVYLLTDSNVLNAKILLSFKQVNDDGHGDGNVKKRGSRGEYYLFQEERLYSIVGRNKRLQLELDNQIIIIEDDPSPPNSSPVNSMIISLVDQGLQELSEKPDYHNSLILLLHRNSRLKVIHSSFFDTMPDLRFLDMSNTDIETLPSSLFNLPKLKVLLFRNCICLDNLPREIGKLIHLEALDVSGAELYNLPDEIGRLASITTMHLSFYGPGYGRGYEHLPTRLVCPSFLAELKKLRTLSISVYHRDHI
ncbi:hypothetical protein OROGR_010746 [Orobanche gracilis]